MALGRQLFLFHPLLALALAGTASAAVIERPKVEIVDDFGVNMASGQVTHSLTAVSIGGPMGLSYTISIYANENWGGSDGFASNFNGEAKVVLLSTEVNYVPWHVMRVSDDQDTVDFKVLVNGQVQSHFYETPLPYTYEPVGDTRHSLEVVGNTLEWTKPDGTVAIFSRGTSGYAGSGGRLSRITYPNGRTVELSGRISVNTGYQLVPMYVLDHRPFDKVDNPNIWGVPPAASSADSGWSTSNPKHMVAINTAIEHCAPAPRPANCPLTHNWPTATFDWPAGMPRTLFIGDSIVTVTRADGASTHFRYRAYDLAYTRFGTVADGYTPGREFSPRLVGIRAPGATRETYTYDYDNLFVFSGSPSGNWNYRVQTSGIIKSATHLQKQAGYSMLQPSFGGQDYRNHASNDADVTGVLMQPKIFMGNTDMIGWADTREGRISFEHNHGRNFPREFNRISRPLERYAYDTRGNLTRVEYQINGNFVTQTEAQYPASCTPTTRKTCNQADWIADAKGNRTHYSYHPQSGQVATVTSPPDRNGRRAQTRYDYSQLSASYFDNSGTRITGSPIWMKTAQRYCINSNYSGSCEAGDEVVTRFEYNHDNLMMTGMTVTADGVTLRTCYQYDRFGNRIGKTAPNANRATCN